MPESEPDSDLLDSIVERVQKGTADRLGSRMREADTIKAKEEAASQRRLEEMWVREHERQRAIADAQAEQRRQEQMLVRYVLVGGVIILTLVVIVAIVLSQF